MSSECWFFYQKSLTQRVERVTKDMQRLLSHPHHSYWKYNSQTHVQWHKINRRILELEKDLSDSQGQPQHIPTMTTKP